MSFRPALLLLTSLTASGCFAGSAQPWFPASERMEEPGAVGTWREEGDNPSVLTVTSLPDKLYRVDLADADNKNTPTRFVVALGRMGKVTWANAQLDNNDPRLKDVDGYLVRPHLPVRFSLEGDKLQLHVVSREWFQEQVNKKRVKLAFVKAPSSDQEMYLFTGTTAQLTQGLKSLEKEPKAFEKPVVFARVKP